MPRLVQSCGREGGRRGGGGEGGVRGGFGEFHIANKFFGGAVFFLIEVFRLIHPGM